MSQKIIAALAVILLASCAERPAPSATPEPSSNAATSSTGQAYFLEPAELSAQMERAKAGDNEAALRVADHYSLSELNPELELPWLVMAAERDDIGAMRSLGYRYGSGMYRDTDCVKAIEWLDRAMNKASPTELKEHGIVELMAEITGGSGTCKGMSPNNSFKPTPLRGAA